MGDFKNQSVNLIPGRQEAPLSMKVPTSAVQSTNENEVEGRYGIGSASWVTQCSDKDQECAGGRKGKGYHFAGSSFVTYIVERDGGS